MTTGLPLESLNPSMRAVASCLSYRKPSRKKPIPAPLTDSSSASPIGCIATAQVALKSTGKPRNLIDRLMSAARRLRTHACGLARRAAQRIEEREHEGVHGIGTGARLGEVGEGAALGLHELADIGQILPGNILVLDREEDALGAAPDRGWPWWDHRHGWICSWSAGS